MNSDALSNILYMDFAIDGRLNRKGRDKSCSIYLNFYGNKDTTVQIQVFSNSKIVLELDVSDWSVERIEARLREMFKYINERPVIFMEIDKPLTPDIVKRELEQFFKIPNKVTIT